MAMNTQSTNHHHYSLPIGQEVLQGPVSTDSGTKYTARMIYTSSFVICPRNPQRPSNPSTDFSASLLLESEVPRPGPRGSRRRILKSFYPAVCLCLGSRRMNVSFDSDPDTVTLRFSRFSPSNTRSNCHLLCYSLTFPLFIPRDTLANFPTISTKSPPTFMFTAINNHPSRN